MKKDFLIVAKVKVDVDTDEEIDEQIEELYFKVQTLLRFLDSRVELEVYEYRGDHHE